VFNVVDKTQERCIMISATLDKKISVPVSSEMKEEIRTLCAKLSTQETGKVNMTDFVRWCLVEGIKSKKAQLEKVGL